MGFSQGATSHMCNFPSGNFPILSQTQPTAPSLFQPRRSASLPILVAALGPHCSLRRLRGPNLTFGKLHLWEVATWEIVTWEVAHEKMPLGKYRTPLILRLQLHAHSCSPCLKTVASIFMTGSILKCRNALSLDFTAQLTYAFCSYSHAYFSTIEQFLLALASKM